MKKMNAYKVKSLEVLMLKVDKILDLTLRQLSEINSVTLSVFFEWHKH
jgi:hypothetical protein